MCADVASSCSSRLYVPAAGAFSSAKESQGGGSGEGPKGGGAATMIDT